MFLCLLFNDFGNEGYVYFYMGFGEIGIFYLLQSRFIPAQLRELRATA